MKLYFWDNTIKPHWLPDSLEAAICDDISERFRAPAAQVIPRDDEPFRIDRGGPMLMSAEWISVDLEGTPFEVPVRDVEDFYWELKAARRGGTGRKTYYKMHGWLHVVVLTPEMRETLLAAWGGRIQEYRDRASAEADKFVHAVAEINKHPNIRLSTPQKNLAPAKSELN